MTEDILVLTSHGVIAVADSGTRSNYKRTALLAQIRTRETMDLRVRNDHQISISGESWTKSISNKSSGIDSKKNTESTPEKKAELSPILKVALEAEIQDVMIKMWQEMPDDAPDAIGKIVVDTFKGDAGDDFGNVLSLNVAKRLLKESNNLFVNMQFNSCMTTSTLWDFYRAHGVQHAKRAPKTRFVYVAQMRSHADFDKLCTAGGTLGNVDFTAEPCYRFLTCPEAISTTFSLSETKDLQEPKNKHTENKSKELDTNVPNKDESVKNETVITNEVANSEDGRENKEIIKENVVVAKIRNDANKHKNEKIIKENVVETKTSCDAYGHKNDRKIKEIEVKAKTTNNAQLTKDDKNTNTNEAKVQSDETKDEKTNAASIIDSSVENVDSISKEVENVGDLDFDDMAAMLADSIVLDECMGSDDE